MTIAAAASCSRVPTHKTKPRIHCTVLSAYHGDGRLPLPVFFIHIHGYNVFFRRRKYEKKILFFQPSPRASNETIVAVLNIAIAAALRRLQFVLSISPVGQEGSPAVATGGTDAIYYTRPRCPVQKTRRRAVSLLYYIRGGRRLPPRRPCHFYAPFPPHPAAGRF